jgi:hypothetical protein
LPDLVIGRRDSGDDDWHWYPVPTGDRPDGKGPRRPRAGLLLAAIGAILTGVGVLLLVLSTDNDSSSGSQPSPTALPASGGPATPRATTAATLASSATPISGSSSPAAPGDVRLFIWSRQQKQWLGSDLAKDDPGYREGDAVPFMIRIDNAVASVLYEVEISYWCHTSDGAAFDYLSNPSAEDSASQTTPPGPGRREDASIPIPDDSAISFDASGRRFKAWGGSFQQAPEGPSPDTPCQTDKRFSLSLMAQGGSMFLIWGGHLASKSDWGENQGASSQRSAIYMEVSVGQTSPQKLGVWPDAIAP